MSFWRWLLGDRAVGRLCGWMLLGVIPLAMQAQTIEVMGLTNQTVWADSASFFIPILPGFAYAADVDGKAVPAGVTNTVTDVNYHELSIVRLALADGSRAERRIQFIVRSSERQDSEWGLPVWTPYPRVDSAPDEFAGTGVRLVFPTEFPAGLEIPIVAWVTNQLGKTVRVNGWIARDGAPTVAVRRGAGSAFLPAIAESGNVPMEFRLHGWRESRELRVDQRPWTSVGGTLHQDTEWPADSRISLDTSLSVPRGVTLSVGPGTVVRCAPGVEFQVAGHVRATGTATAPIVVTPVSREQPWGGFVLRTNTAQLVFHHTILWGGGAETNWFKLHPGSGTTHRQERPMIYLQSESTATLTDCAILDSHGQATHGEHSRWVAERTLVQRHQTGGQHNGGEVILNDCALLEFPLEGAPFVDLDNDGLYLTGNGHGVTNTVIGWCLDDALDSGTGSAGRVSVANCWFENCYHEGLAWSESRIATVRDCVVMNCGQGLEVGFGNPDVTGERILCLGNVSGIRFGDNYEKSYRGFLRLTNCWSLYNYRDVFARTWGRNRWTNEFDQMELRQVRLTQPDSQNLPDCPLWNPSEDAAHLAEFLSVPPGSHVGAAVARRERGPASWAEVRAGVPVRLSRFATNEVTVDYAWEVPTGATVHGNLRYLPGQTVLQIPPPELPTTASVLRLSLSAGQGSVITGGETTYWAADTLAEQLQYGAAFGQRWLFWSDPTAVLESATELSGPWSAEVSARSPYTAEISNTRFFRLRLGGSVR